MSVQKKASAIARDIAAELGELERKLVELQADAEAIHFWQAAIRLTRMTWLASSIGAGLRRQASKVEARER